LEALVSQPNARYVEVARRFREFPTAGIRTVDPASEEELAAAEDALGCRFPESYRRFQLEFGRVRNGPLDIYTVRPADPTSTNIVAVNLVERRSLHRPLLSHLVAFSDSGGGDRLCFDASACEAGECRIVWWDHEADPGEPPQTAAASFLDWMEAELRERAAEEKGSLLDGLGHAYAAWVRDWQKKGL
jgi:hypothetical protein